jgi:hypothetical protein
MGESRGDYRYYHGGYMDTMADTKRVAENCT